MAAELDTYEAKTGIHVPIHVDAASGGFVAPFAYPDYKWDFKVPRVQSINASGHKYGMSESFLFGYPRYPRCPLDQTAC